MEGCWGEGAGQLGARGSIGFQFHSLMTQNPWSVLQGWTVPFQHTGFWKACPLDSSSLNNPIIIHLFDYYLNYTFLRNQQEKKCKQGHPFCMLLSPEHASQPIFTLACGVFILRTLCTQPLFMSRLFPGCFLAPKSTIDSWLSAHPTSSWKAP